MVEQNLTAAPMIIPPQAADDDGQVLRGSTLVVQDWPAQGDATQVAPMHVHYADDEAWHVISGALLFRFKQTDLVVKAGSTLLVPAGVAHTFGNAGPARSRFLIILPARLDALISELHRSSPGDHAAVYRKYQSELLD
jgi:mannose-6-phosphate isomerase-like protein (cupin superfamily)